MGEWNDLLPAATCFELRELGWPAPAGSTCSKVSGRTLRSQSSPRP